MRRNIINVTLAACCTLTTLAQTEFSYQGRLEDAGRAANGEFDLRFRLYGAPSGGAQIGGTISVNDWPITDGLITTSLDFGVSPFSGAPRWLQIEIRPGNSAGAYTPLSPRQALTAVPYAMYAFGGPGGASQWAANGLNMYSTNAGSVGIGTTSPDAQLDVAGAVLSSGPAGGLLIARNPNNPVASFSLGWLNDVARLRIGGDGAGASGGLDIQRTGDNSLMRILHNGNVGIGTTAPNARAHIVGDGVGTVMRLTNGGGANTALIVSDVGGSGRAASFYGVTSNRLVQIQNDGSGPALTAFGDVGIGVSTPNARLSISKSESDNRPAVSATNAGTGAAGVFANTNASNNSPTVYCGASGGGPALFADHGSSGTGVHGAGDIGVYGLSTADAGSGVFGLASGRNSAGVLGQNTGVGGWSAKFLGSAVVDGNFFVTNGTKYFMIDNPLNPSEENLFHSCVESDEMKNIYDGVVELDADGAAEVVLPEWFDLVNGDFRYQLTCVGGYAPVYIAAEIKDNRFRIAGGKSGLKVSWMVTGVRIDPAALAADFHVIRQKPTEDRGTYLFPAGYGQAVAAESGLIANPMAGAPRD